MSEQTTPPAPGSLPPAPLSEPEICARRVVDLIRRAVAEADRLRAALAACAPAKPIDDEEKKRRLRYFVNRAKQPDGLDGAIGKRICAFCETVHTSPSALKKHLVRAHLEKIAVMPQELFGQP